MDAGRGAGPDDGEDREADEGGAGDVANDAPRAEAGGRGRSRGFCETRMKGARKEGGGGKKSEIRCPAGWGVRSGEMDPRRRRASRDDATPTGVRGRLPRGERATRRARRGRAPPPPPRAWLQSRRPPTRARARLGCCRCTSAAYGLAVPRGRPGIGAGERGARARVPWAIAHLRSEAACVRFARTPCRSRAGVRRARGAKCTRARHPLRSSGFQHPLVKRARRKADARRAPTLRLKNARAPRAVSQSG